MTSLHPVDASKALSVDEIVRRAKTEFGFVQVDPEQGQRYLAKKVAGNGELSHQEKERAVGQAMDAVELIIGDDRRADKHFLKCYAIPNQAIDVVYLYESHATNTKSLIDRLASALGYLVNKN